MERDSYCGQILTSVLGIDGMEVAETYLNRNDNFRFRFSQESKTIFGEEILGHFLIEADRVRLKVLIILKHSLVMVVARQEGPPEVRQFKIDESMTASIKIPEFVKLIRSEDGKYIAILESYKSWQGKPSLRGRVYQYLNEKNSFVEVQQNGQEHLWESKEDGLNWFTPMPIIRFTDIPGQVSVGIKLLAI